MMTNLRSFYLSALTLLIFMVGFIPATVGQSVSTTLGNRTFDVREQVDFNVVTTRGTAPENTNVRLRFSLLGDNATVLGTKINMEYLENGEWVALPFTNGVATFGPESGFPLTDATRQFRATFGAAGNLGYRVDIVPAAGGEPLAGATETFNVNAISSPTVNTSLDEYQPGEITSGRNREFRLYYSAGDRTADLVYIKYVFNNEQRDNVSLFAAPNEEEEPIEFTAFTRDEQGNLIYWPEGGIPLTGTSANQTSLLMRVNFAEAGTYAYQVQLVHTNGVVVAMEEETVTISEGATIMSTLNNMENVMPDANTDFSVAITQGGEAVGPVRIRFTLANLEQALNVTLLGQATAGGEYEALTAAEGAAWFGPEAGFALADGTYNFRVRFDEPGTYAYTIDLVKMTSNRVIASSSETVTVGNTTSVKDKIENTKIVAYPTISTGSVRVSLGNVRDAQISVVDILGKTVMTIDRASGEAEINTTRFANGTYFVRVSKGSEVAVSRFIVN